MARQVEWINGDLDAPADEVVEHFTGAAYASVARDEPSGGRPAPGG